MPIMHICDADRKTILKPDEVCILGWGYKRIYSPEAYKDVAAYYEALQDAAKQSRLLFVELQEKAAQDFHKKYPNGRLAHAGRPKGYCLSG